MVTTSAARLASHAWTHGRSSARRMLRPRTAKKTAMSSADATWALVLQRQSNSPMGVVGQILPGRGRRTPMAGLSNPGVDPSRHAGDMLIALFAACLAAQAVQVPYLGRPSTF